MRCTIFIAVGWAMKCFGSFVLLNDRLWSALDTVWVWKLFYCYIAKVQMEWNKAIMHEEMLVATNLWTKLLKTKVVGNYTYECVDNKYLPMLEQ